MLKRHFKKLFTFATKSSCFTFNNTYYRQTDGVSMGSPLGPTLANLFLCHHETNWLDCCPLQFKPVYYKRYVDDVFLLFRSKTHVKKFLNYLNSRHKNIQFSYEEENNDVLPFLDVKVQRINNQFNTSIYRKSTFSGVYLNYKSYLPKEYKHGLLFTLLFRAFTISSDYETFHQEIEKLKVIWCKNAFPCFIIDKCIRNFLDKLFVEKREIVQPPSKKEKTLVLPYLGNISLQLKRRLRNVFRIHCPEIKLNVVFKSAFRLSTRFHYKDIIPRDLNSLIIYRFTCNTCNSVYIGETKRHFLVRAYEHLGVSILTNGNYSYNENTATAVGKHCHDLNHACNLDDFMIIGNAKNKYHLGIKEALIIHKDKPELNKNKQAATLHLFT